MVEEKCNKRVALIEHPFAVGANCWGKTKRSSTHDHLKGGFAVIREAMIFQISAVESCTKSFRGAGWCRIETWCSLRGEKDEEREI